MSQLTYAAAAAFGHLIDEAGLTNLACAEMLELTVGGKWSKASVNAKRRGITPLSIDNLDELARFFAVPVTFFFLDRDARRMWLGENKWCAPWELNPQPADSRSAAFQASFFDDDWDSGGSSEPIPLRRILDLTGDEPVERLEPAERLSA